MKKITFLILCPSIALVISACQSPAAKVSEKVSEKMAEKAIENASGGKADVDLSQGKMDVKTAEGSMQIGADIKLPADFPADVYVAEGKITAAIKANGNNGYTVSIESDQSLVDLKSAYEQKLPEQGWKITGTMDFGASASVMAEKDERSLSVILGRSDNKSSIVLTVAEK
jgi:hypothetical protein